MKGFVFLLLTFVAFSTASAEPIIVIVRHAEKVDNSNDPDLSEIGQKRAAALAQTLKDAHITAIFTTEFKRTQETAAPLSKAIGITPTIVPAKDYAALVAKLHQVDGTALVVGHGNTIPDVVKALEVDTPVKIPDDEYSDLFVIVRPGKPRLLQLHY